MTSLYSYFLFLATALYDYSSLTPSLSLSLSLFPPSLYSALSYPPPPPPLLQEDEWKEEEEVVKDFEGLRVQKLDKEYVKQLLYNI